MRQILSGWVSIVVGLLGLWVSLKVEITKFTTWQVLFFMLAALGLLFMISWDIYSYKKTKPIICKNTNDIDTYMHNWVSQRGRAMIFTRDMSWAQDDPIKRLLMEKAGRHELEICLPRNTPLTDELVAAGAKVHMYGDLLSEPYSRFTIIRYGRDDAQVAIGRFIDGTHRIAEYSAGQDPVFSIAYDLVRLVNKFSSQNDHAYESNTTRSYESNTTRS